MKPGDLIRFRNAHFEGWRRTFYEEGGLRPPHLGIDGWSNPCLILKQYDDPTNSVWVVLLNNKQMIVDLVNYEIEVLSEGG